MHRKLAGDADVQSRLLLGAHAALPTCAWHLDVGADELERLLDEWQLFKLLLVRGRAGERRHEERDAEERANHLV